MGLGILCQNLCTDYHTQIKESPAPPCLSKYHNKTMIQLTL